MCDEISQFAAALLLLPVSENGRPPYWILLPVSIYNCVYRLAEAIMTTNYDDATMTVKAVESDWFVRTSCRFSNAFARWLRVHKTQLRSRNNFRLRGRHTEFWKRLWIKKSDAVSCRLDSFRKVTKAFPNATEWHVNQRRRVAYERIPTSLAPYFDPGHCMTVQVLYYYCISICCQEVCGESLSEPWSISVKHKLFMF